MSDLLDRWHLTARNSFVPFCLALFCDERLTASGKLPGDNKEALDKESLTALEGILREVLLQKLVEMGGWKKLGIYYEGQARSKRLWEVDFSLVLSSRTIQWLIFIHNKEWSKAACLEPSTAGDMLFFDLVYSQVAKKRRFKIDRSVFERSPLTLLLSFKSADARILSAIRDFVPWLESYIIRRWSGAYQLIWKNRSDFAVSIKAQTHLFKDMIKEDSTKFFSLLCHWFSTVTKQGLNRERVCLQNFKSELSYLKDKQELSDLWLNNLLLVEDLYQKYESCTGIHPIDRTELDKLYLEIWAANGMNRIRDVILSIKTDFNQLAAGDAN